MGNMKNVLDVPAQVRQKKPSTKANETNGGVWLKSESASALDMQEAKTCHTAAKTTRRIEVDDSPVGNNQPYGERLLKQRG